MVRLTYSMYSNVFLSNMQIYSSEQWTDRWQGSFCKMRGSTHELLKELVARRTLIEHKEDGSHS